NNGDNVLIIKKYAESVSIFACLYYWYKMNEDVLGRLESMVKVISAGDLAPLRDVTDCKEHVNKVWDMFKESDIGIVNLEMPLTHSNEKTDKAINFKADPKIAYSLSEAGIDVVSFANN